MAKPLALLAIVRSHSPARDPILIIILFILFVPDLLVTGRWIIRYSKLGLFLDSRRASAALTVRDMWSMLIRLGHLRSVDIPNTTTELTSMRDAH